MSISSHFLDPPSVHKTQTPIMIVYAVLFSPIFEELICRKLILNQLNKHTNNNISITISALVFSVLHFDLTGFLGYVFLGIVWGYYYKKSNSIFVPILSHFLFNYFIILTQSVKG
ncbi:CPBP family intramembrane metalloprotease [Paenibacillus sp. HJL G12]|uniref:CPBP family intramembrane metalloprotease n=2 Tax=Paenibacillus dendrobii TaxID=2691084 RepID=A0A7X3LIQ1_9BACL|nr:CPBP family intramembrane metalloprotease [Paenibacillus dendrobii]